MASANIALWSVILWHHVLNFVYIQRGQHSSFMGNLKIPEKASLWFQLKLSQVKEIPNQYMYARKIIKKIYLVFKAE